MTFFILVFLVYTAVNAYLFRKGWQALPRTARRIYVPVFLFFYSAFIMAMLGRNVLPLALQKALYLPGTVWMGAMLYLTLWFLATDFVYLILRPLRRRRMLFRRVQAVAGYALVSILLTIGYYRFAHPVVEERTIEIQKAGGEPLTIVAVSDLHLGVAIDKKRLQQYVRQINRQHPDLILIAGDLIDNNVRPLVQEKMHDDLHGLQAPLGVYMCLGNHEYLSGIADSRRFLQSTDIRLLVDTTVLIDGRLQLIGRDDLAGNPRRQSLQSLVAAVDTTRPLLLLDHEPWVLSDAVANHVDLQFSGHTHQGQLWPLSCVVRRLFPLAYGYRQTGRSHLYVSSGLGLWGPPFRIGTQSEIVVFHLRFSGKE
jgi:predicted MPP superfamily phosphohydrolase